jgi:hypothetical protein
MDKLLVELRELFSNEIVINTGNFSWESKRVCIWYSWKLKEGIIVALANYPEQAMSVLSVDKDISESAKEDVQKTIETITKLRGYEPKTSNGNLYTNYFWYKKGSVGGQINYFFRSLNEARKSISLEESQNTPI